MTYEPVGGVLLRATRSRDIRAANLVELFTPGVSIVGAIVDFGRPGNPSLSVPTTTVGNTALAPEEADTTTIGITWQPSFIPGLRASADYYRIDLTDAIGSLGGQNIVNACNGRAPFTVADPSFCSLISRDPATNVITNVRNQTLNLAFVNTQGVDLEVSYRMPLANLASSLPGTITMRLLGTYIDKFDNNNGIVTVDRAGEIGNARWRMTGSTAYQNGRFGAYLQARYFDAAKIDNTFGPNDIDSNRVPSRIYVDGSGRYTVREGNDGSRIEVFGNVNNLFDKAPPIVPSQSAGQGQAPLAPDYDRIGRYYSIGVNLHF